MKKLLKGNEAIAEAAIQAGCRFFFGYPITPQNQIPEYMSKRMPQVGGCFLQAESEVAAINMVYGAAGAGARVMTSSSSPGISLKQEGISYIVGAELPCVIVNMVRGGPGLGSIQPAQSDYYQATRGGGHGDYRMCVLAPSSVQEADLKPKTWAATGHVPTADSPRAVINSLYIDPQAMETHCQHLQAKYDAIEAAECRWQEEMVEDAEIVLVAYGTTSRIARSAMRKCREQGVRVGLIRPITLWPFPEAAIRATLPTAKKYLCVEMSMGQMIDDVRLAVNGERPVEFYGRTGGMVPTVKEIVDHIMGMAQPSGFAGQVDQAIGSMGEKLGEMGRKLDEKLNSPEFVEKTEALKKQAADVAGKAADGLAKGATLMAEGIGKAIDAIKKSIDGDQNPKGGDR